MIHNLLILSILYHFFLQNFNNIHLNKLKNKLILQLKKNKKNLNANEIININIIQTNWINNELKMWNDNYEYYDKIWNKIDVDCNEDIDITEWMQSLQKNSNNNNKNNEFQFDESYLKLLFAVITFGTDDDYMSKEDFILFCIQNYQTQHVKRLQNEFTSMLKSLKTK